MQKRKLAATLGLLSATMLTLPAAAQNAAPANPDQPGIGVETVTVTARRQPEDLEKIPVTVTAISGDALHEAGITDALGLAQVAPSLTVTGNLGSRDTDVFTIRGQSQPFGGADPGVQTYFDEVPFNASSQGAYYDLKDVQVLSGPQGTLFGRSTTGGAVLFEPRRPVDAFGGYIDGQTGNYSLYELSGALNVPLGDTLAIRVAGDVANRDGFTKDVSTGTELDNLDYQAFRVGVDWKPTANFDNYLVYDYFHDDNHGTGAALTGVNTATIDGLATEITGSVCTSPPANAVCGAIDNFELGLLGALANQQALGPRKTTSSILPGYKRDSWGATDIAEFDVTPNITLRNIFAYRADKEQPSFDYDGSFLPLLDIPNSRTWETNSYQVTEEFQVRGNTDNDALQWIVGLYHELDRPNGYSEIERQTLGGPQSPFSPLVGFGSDEFDQLNNGGTSNAVYAQANWKATDKLTLTAGGRYTWDHKVATGRTCFEYLTTDVCPFPLNGPELTLADNFRAPSWTLAADYQVTDDTMTYITYRRGYKSGGFNSGAGAATDYEEFKPEFLTDMEVGTKNNWTILGVPGRTNFDAYYGWYQDIQKNDLVPVVQLGIIPLPPPNPPLIEPVSISPVALTFNAARATIKGLDFSSTFVPDENFQVSVFYSYTDASYDKFLLPQEIVIDPFGDQSAQGLTDHKGDPFAYTPENKIGFSPRLRVPGGDGVGDFYLSGTLYWQSQVWFTDLSDIETTCSAFAPPPVAGAPYTCLAPGGKAPEQKGYALVNLRFDWDNVLGSSFDASAFVNNLFDRTYGVGANALLHLTGTSATIYGDPRMYGVELRYRFGADDAQ